MHSAPGTQLATDVPSRRRFAETLQAILPPLKTRSTSSDGCFTPRLAYSCTSLPAGWSGLQSAYYLTYASTTEARGGFHCSFGVFESVPKPLLPCRLFRLRTVSD
jgi:hypothetical protein